MSLQIEHIIYDQAKGSITNNQQQHKLTKIQKKLMDYFIAHPHEIISKDILMQQVWGRIVTDNTINKFISTLRSYLEHDSSKPKIIVTHFGHGISFEGSISEVSQQQKPHTVKLLLLLLLVVLVLMAVVKYSLNAVIPNKHTDINLSQNQHLLVLPTVYQNMQIDETKQQGRNQLLKDSLNQDDSEGTVIFNPANLNNRQAIEKYWHVDKELLVLQSRVIKNGDIYESVMQLTQGSKVIAESRIKHASINELLNLQISQISNYQKGRSQQGSSLYLQADDQLIQALSYAKSRQFDQAKTLLQKLINKKPDNYQARLELAKIYLHENNATESLLQLNALKKAPVYNQMATEIELLIAENNYNQHQYEKVITALKQYQATHNQLGEVKKAKIKLYIADAYLAQADLQKAMQFYKQALLNVNEAFNPDLFARSYYGQARVLLNDSNGQTVYELFEKSLAYAKTSENLEYQILALDEMAKMKLVSNQWEKGIALKKQALEIMELENDKGKVAQGLGTLTAFLIQSGHFTEAQKVNDRLGKIARELNNDALQLSYLHYDAVLLLNVFKFEQAKVQIDKQLELAKSTNNIRMQLDNAFLEFELRLAKKDMSGFKQEWDKRTKMIKDLGFERYQVYMDLYLARYYKQTQNFSAAKQTIGKISENAKANNDIKILVDAQEQLAQVYLKSNPEKALEVLNKLEQYHPDANPFLELKALVLNQLGQKQQALVLLKQAKAVFHEAWKSENQILLEQLQQ